MNQIIIGMVRMVMYSNWKTILNGSLTILCFPWAGGGRPSFNSKFILISSLTAIILHVSSETETKFCLWLGVVKMKSQSEAVWCSYTHKSNKQKSKCLNRKYYQQYKMYNMFSYIGMW